MRYDIHITRRAEQDLWEAADYIEFEKFNPAAADHLLDIVEEQIQKLSDFPKEHPLAPDNVLKSWGIRYFPVRKYLVIYTIRDKTVYFVRFLHQRRDWIQILRQNVDETMQMLQEPPEDEA